MLFDLRGKGRRRTVQVIYVSLAILMGGGLVLFGIEAVARRHFTGYILAVFVLAVVVLVALVFAQLVIQWGWRYPITITFLSLAVILLFVNIQELGRD